MNNPPERHCYDKVRYMSRKAARQALRRFKRTAVANQTLHEYECPTCRFWHLGNAWAAMV